MPTTGLPFRVYFFWFGSVAWFDQDVHGGRVFGGGTLEQVWPDVAALMITDNDEEAPIDKAHPVSPTVLRLSRQDASFSRGVAYVDVLRGVAVPSPIDDELIAPGHSQVISWDPGPVLMTLDASGSNLQLVDVRTGLRGPTSGFNLGHDEWPILAIPGEPVRQFFNAQPVALVLSHQADGSEVSIELPEAFPRLPFPAVEATTVMYGDFRRPTVSDVTAELDDGELAVLASAASIVHDDGPALLAALVLLTGASPAAFHPDGHYGIAHMTAEQLATGGWPEPPEAIIAAGAERQFEILGQYLAVLDPSTTDTMGKVLAVLATGTPVAGGDDTVVVPAPVPARFANLVPTGDDGLPEEQITVGSLQRMIDFVLTGQTGQELFGRCRTFGFV